MKKNILSAVLILTIYASGIAPTHAIFCSNCSQWSQQMLDYFRQGLQYAKDAATAAATPVTAAQQTLETVNNKILIPMRDAMTIVLIMKSGDNIKNLVLGSLGTQPLLIKDPAGYYKQRALGSIGVDLSILSRPNSVYDSSVLSSLINTNRYNQSSAASKLEAINRSTIPSSMQRKVCDDAVLTKIARDDVQASVQDGTLDESAYTDRKRELYRALCSGDPNTNPALAATLTKLASDRPDIGGWDSWLALTGGDNPYNRAVQSQGVISQKAQETVDLAKLEYTIGGGIRNLTTCKKYAENDLNGNLYGETETPGCALEEIKQAASTINSTYLEAINAPIKLLQNTLGPGAGNLVNTAFTSINLIRGISSAMESVSGGSSGGGGAAPTNVPIGTVSTSTPVRDLTNNPTMRESLTTPPKQQLQSHLSSLSELERVDRSYLTDIPFYQNQLSVMKSCYDGLAQDYPNTASDPRTTSALAYYQSKSDANSTLQVRINTELELVATTRTLVTDTLNRITSSQSSEEILSLFNSYQNQVDSQNLPNFMSGGTRQAEYITFRGDIDQSLAEGGAVYNFKADCATIRQQIEASNFNGAGA